MQRLLYLSIGLSIAIILFASIGTSIKKQEIKEATNGDIKKEQEDKAVSSGNKLEYQIIGNEYSFSPSSIEAGVGDEIEITFRNVGDLPHNLVIEGQNVSTKTVQRGQSDTITFSATEAASLRYYCSIGNHAALGMEGILEVK